MLSLLNRTCPLWCVDCWRDIDPGVRFHRGAPSVLGAAEVSVERYDDAAGPGAVSVSLLAPLDLSLSPPDARGLAALLLNAADEAEQ